MPTIDATTWRSPNHSARPAGADIWALIIHSCEGSPPGNEEQSSLPWLCNPDSEVSAHYYITRAGAIYQLVDDALQAWHAGVSMLNGVWYCNGFSTGVELEHKKGSAAYPVVQMQALTWLAQRQIAAYAIPRSGIATHRKVAQNAGRTDRSDPTDWSDADFDHWADALYVPADPLRARTLPGVPGTPALHCSASTYTFYNQRGGLSYCGYPLADEFHALDQGHKDCWIFPCERVVIKTSNGYGVEQSLIAEAMAQGWTR